MPERNHTTPQFIATTAKMAHITLSHITTLPQMLQIPTTHSPITVVTQMFLTISCRITTTATVVHTTPFNTITAVTKLAPTMSHPTTILQPTIPLITT